MSPVNPLGNVVEPLSGGGAAALKSATTVVDVSAAAAPTAGDVLTASSSTAAAWAPPAAVASVTPVAASKLVGRGSASGAGASQDITLGSGLSMTGTTLSAAAGAPGGTGAELQYRAGASTLGGAAGTAVTPATGAIVLTAQANSTTPLTIIGSGTHTTTDVFSVQPTPGRAQLAVSVPSQTNAGIKIYGAESNTGDTRLLEIYANGTYGSNPGLLVNSTGGWGEVGLRTTGPINAPQFRSDNGSSLGSDGYQIGGGSTIRSSTGNKWFDGTADAYILQGGGSPGTLKWGAASATPIAYLHTMASSSRGGTDTDVAGASATLRAGNGTGTGGSGSLILQAAPVDATGTAANTPQAVATFAAGATTITTTTPTAVAASTAGNSVTIAASNATAGLSSAGAATGGSVNIAAGNAARYSSGNANGGDISLSPGTGIGTGVVGMIRGTGSPGTRGIRLVGDTPSVDDVLMWYTGSAFKGTLREFGVTLGASRRYAFSSSDVSVSEDVYMRRKAAANPAWGLAAASPVAYTHTLSGESRGGTDTDVQGAAAIIQPGNGTGTGGSGALKTQTAYPGATGTTANTYSDREVFAPKWTTLTESSATAIATLTFGASSVVGAEFLVTIESNDGTDYQALTSRVRVSSVRKATGNTVSTVALVGTDLLAESAGTSTLTATYTLTEGASAVTLNVNAVSSLTQTTLRATFQAVSNGPGVTIAQS